ncbi:ABC transporter permease subunit [Cryobacterium sp. CG_9.6]|uniref:ABC transporter permease subunit n=1 Tax=Cryobacterium sp. CG_9.6 TaxID=2760710 RepID=UPI0024768136|nr:ABC transporter permease subunit [Cryobacterium sp. CG_9.6]MDH6236111.1 ABC-2 type transport system permease protein [Cryobacterium sp. CG_9.6]
MTEPAVRPRSALRTAHVHRAHLPVFGKVFTDSWRSLIGWGLGLAAAASLYLPIFPSMNGNAQMQELINSLPPELTRSINYDQIGTGPGYVQATLFGLIGFMLLSIAGIAWGAAALGGDEESGQLELTLAHGVTRVQVALSRYAALVVKILGLTALTCVLVLLWNGPAELSIDGSNLLGTGMLFGGLILLSASVALFCGALTGRRIWGIGGGAAVAVVGYVFNAIGNQSSNVEWLHALSPYYWAFGHTPLSSGANWGTVVVFSLVSVGLGVATAGVLRHRDVGV